MESARWIDWWDKDVAMPRADRVYFGHETCQQRLPSLDRAQDICQRASDVGLACSLVVPFLTDRGLARTLRLVEHLASAIDLEVVSSDWGLIGELCSLRIAVPVLGRLLTAQHTDPRMARVVAADTVAESRLAIHLDGTLCNLERKAPSATLTQHYRTCWVDRPDIVALFQDWGVHRCEISNTVQGIELMGNPGWAYSLHLSDVLVAVTRTCPGENEHLDCPEDCHTCHSRAEKIAWTCDGVPLPFFRRDNALFYASDDAPPNLTALPIDRIVSGIRC